MGPGTSSARSSEAASGSGSGSQGIAIPPRKAALEIIKPVITSKDHITQYWLHRLDIEEQYMIALNL